MPQQSEQYRGPLVHFTTEELRRIRDLTFVLSKAPVDYAIRKKIEVALNSDPKWKEPTP